MNNYQLYRTNVLLGGQMKYDLILSSNPDNHTYIKDIHISPISKHAPYNQHIDDNILNYNHNENIKNFYRKTENYFYNDFVNPILNNIYPLTENYIGENKETTYEMGCRRMKYHLYNKQFEFLCPVWLEYIEDIKDLKFDINMYTGEHKKKLISRTVSFDQDKIIEYFNNYIKQLKLNEGCDWVFNIGKDRSVLTGFNVSTGQIEDKELLRLYNDLVSIERPVLEFNNIIINTINSNHMITKQLFNFNLCFNFEDILNPFLINELDNQCLYVDVRVSIKDQHLQFMDIFSNHTNIIKECTEIPMIQMDDYNNLIVHNNASKLVGDTNVFDYLKDYDCVDLIDKNKIIQNTCHWCYSSDPNNTTFNAYDGFSLSTMQCNDIGEKYFINIPYYNGKMPNLQTIDPNSPNYPFWCNTYAVTKKGEDSEGLFGGEDATWLVDDIEKYLPYFLNKENHLFSEFSNDCVVNGINYKTKQKYKPIKSIVLFCYDDQDDLIINVQKTLNQYPGWVYGFLVGGDTPQQDKYNDIMFIVPYNNSSNDRKIIFVYNLENYYSMTCFLNLHALWEPIDYGHLYYRNMIHHLSKFKNDDKYKNYPTILKEFYDILSSPNLQYNKIIHFNKSLVGIHANSPSLSSKEIYYYRKNNDKTIIRNLGKIKPYFISDDNERYYNLKYSKKYLEEMKDIYYQYSNTSYGPKYPSLGYFSLDSNKENYIDSQNTNNIEYHHYTNNRIFDLQQTITFNCIMEDNESSTINNNIRSQIEKLYGGALKAMNWDKDDYENNLKYITDQYKLVHTNIEYEDGNFVYEMQIKLK